MKIAIHGASGHMGQCITRIARKDAFRRASTGVDRIGDIPSKCQELCQARLRFDFLAAAHRALGRNMCYREKRDAPSCMPSPSHTLKT